MVNVCVHDLNGHRHHHQQHQVMFSVCIFSFIISLPLSLSLFLSIYIYIHLYNLFANCNRYFYYNSINNHYYIQMLCAIRFNTYNEVEPFNPFQSVQCQRKFFIFEEWKNLVHFIERNVQRRETRETDYFIIIINIIIIVHITYFMNVMIIVLFYPLSLSLSLESASLWLYYRL